MDKDKILDEIFSDDPLGILVVKPKASQARTTDERLVASFEEINLFIDKVGKAPEGNLGNIEEYKLFSRLENLSEDTEKHLYLNEYDRHKLLPSSIEKVTKPKEINSIDDILGDDMGGLLGDDDLGLFDFEHTPKQTTMPDYVARRKKCKDFHKFEHLLQACQQELSSGIRKLIPFKNEQQINAGCFYVLQGVLLFVETVGKREVKNGKVNARLRCIFENGTESDMMLRSLAAELYKNGRRITVKEDELLTGFKDVSDKDEATGHIYILKSLSKKPEIQSIQNLYKIGFASTSVEERIKNAEKEPTYLMAGVRIVQSYQCLNMNPQKLEALIHKVFSKVCLDLDVFDNEGKRHSPREWFIVPLHIIEQTIEFIINGEITDLYYDEGREELRYH